MSSSRAPGDAHLRQRSGRTVTNSAATRDNDNSNFSLTLRPADFGNEPRDPAHSDASGSPTSSSSRQAAAQARSTFKRRELVELAGNPFVVDPNSPRANGQPPYRQDIYPAYDPSGRRIGLDHVRNPSAASETRGYYRKHVLEYDSARAAPLPLPSQMAVQSRYPEQGPLPPVSAVIAGIPAESQYGVGTFSHIQNRPRTPHEILGLPPGSPLNLWSLADPETPDSKPQYNYHVLVKLAILGNKGQRATLQDILRAIRLRFPYYAKLPKQEAIAFGNSIRHLLSLLAAFVREPKPVTEPGKGSYWRVDFSKGEGNKRVRKRNKPQKKTTAAQSGDGQETRPEDSQDTRSESDDSQPAPSASTELSSSKSSIEAHPVTPKARGGRKPAPKNLITTPNGGTATVSIPSAGASQSELSQRLDPTFSDRGVIDAASMRRVSPTSGPYLQLHPSNIGAHRERVVRGATRNAPYPSPLVMPRGTSSSSGSASSEHDNGHTSVSVDKNGQYPSMSPMNADSLIHEHHHKQQSSFGTGSRRDHENSPYTQQYSLDNDSRYGSVSPQESPLSAQSTLSPFANKPPLLPGSSSQYSNRVSHNATPFESPAGVIYGPPRRATPNIASLPDSRSVPGPSSTLPSSSSYGFAAYVGRRDTNGFTPMSMTPRIPQREEAYTNLVSWESINSHAESSSLRR